jgi:hypothetical protein
MTITTATGHIDYKTGYIIPNDGTTWAALTATTWESYFTWDGFPADPLIWVTNSVDFGRIGYFNIEIASKYRGNLSKYVIWASNSGFFTGEEQEYVIEEGDENIPAFYGRYFRVGVWVYQAGQPTVIEDLTIKATNQSYEFDFADVDTRDLPTWASVDSTATLAGAYVLDVGRKSSRVLSVFIQPHFIGPGGYYNTGYATAGYSASGYHYASDQYDYFEEIDYGVICNPSIVKKTIYSNSLTNQVGTVFTLQDQNGDYMHNIVDIRLKAYPEQYMQNGQLSQR